MSAPLKLAVHQFPFVFGNGDFESKIKHSAVPEVFSVYPCKYELKECF